MTTVSENDGTNASWLQKRSSVFNNVNTTHKPSPKVVDKELARLKNMGVSSVWSNKFVKQDNSGGTRQSMTSPPPTSPRSPVFNTRTRTLSAASNKKMAEDIHAALENDTKNNLGHFSKSSVSSLDLNENKQRSARSSVASSITSSVPSSPVVESHAKSVASMDEAASLWFQCETLKTQFAQSNARLSKANQDIDFYKRQLEQTGELARQAAATVQEKEVSAPTSPVVAPKSAPAVNLDEAASLWFECETLKTQFAQNNAKLIKAQQDIEFYKRQLEQTGELARQAIIQDKEFTAPTSPVVTPKSVPATDVDEAASLWFQCETLKTQFAQTNAKLTKANQDIEFYKRQLEQTGELARQAADAVQEKEVSAPTSPVVTPKSVPATDVDEAASLWFQCETLKTQFAQTNAKLTKANEDIDFFKRQLKQTGELARQASDMQDREPFEPTSPIATSKSVPATNIDEAASLWFQCETLKTQFAQSNARLNKANEDIEFYKRQLEQNGELARQGAAAVAEDKEREKLRVRQLAELIVKQDKLLGEYEINLDSLTRLTNESAYLEETQVEMNRLREEVSALNKQKLIMEGSIATLRAELEMSYSQMRLMMQVSTEIQNEFDSYKDKIDSDVKELLAKKQEEHNAEVLALRQGLGLPVSRGIDEEEMTKQLKEATAKVTAAAAATADLVAADTEKTLGSLRDQVNVLTEALQKKDATISEALQAKDKAVSEAIEANKALGSKERALNEAVQKQETMVIEMETRLKNQKMVMDAQMMKLNQTILEKDTLLMEFMSSRNNSREVISAAASMSPSTVVPSAAVTDTYYHQNESRLQINQVRNYMFSSSEDEDEEPEVLNMSYSTDEEEDTPQHHDHYLHRLSDTNTASTPQSPADTISSAISFDSDEEEEKVAEIKHFSYSSVQSQSTRPGSYLSSSGSVSGTDDMEYKRSSLRNSSRISKDVKTASWPMPPPTPPPSEPLPPVPVLYVPEEAPVREVKQSATDVPPPRRARSKTMARDEAPDMSLYTTSVHQNNQLPRIVPVQREPAPIPAPRKDLANVNDRQADEEPRHTKWMDDPESEEDDLWCEANATPKQMTQEW